LAVKVKLPKQDVDEEHLLRRRRRISSIVLSRQVQTTRSDYMPKEGAEGKVLKGRCKARE
jgi:hypothetical protein